MKRSLFEPLKEEGLTSLQIRYNWKTDKGYMIASKEWEPDIDWANYNKTWYCYDLLTDDDIRLNNKETRAMYEKYGLTDYVEEVFDILRKGRFYGFDCYYNSQKDWRFTANLHTVKLGVRNMDQGVYTGGIRRHDKDEEEIEVLIDGLNLGRAQTYKNISSNLEYGGGKITVMSEQIDLEDKAGLGFLSFALDRVRFFTGPDMNYPVELADAMNEFTPMICAGLKHNAIGPSGDPTAYGTTAAMKEAVKFHFGKDSMKGMKVAVMGLGAVGYPQAGYLIKEGCDLIVCDPYEPLIDQLKAEYPDANIEAVSPEEILTVDADIFCPCAKGGFITEEVIDNFKFKMVFGAANNQLHASNAQDEIKLAERMAARGILYQECWVQNIGGVMSGWNIYKYRENADRPKVMQEIWDYVGPRTKQNLEQAKERGITPTENAYRNVDEVLYGEE